MPHSPRSMFGISPAQWRDIGRGAVAIAPLMPGSAVFGLAFGALARTVGIEPWVAVFASASVVAGASQFAIVEALASGAPAVIAVVTALVINARFALYSAALAPLFAAFPRRWQLGLSYLMTDQSAVVSIQHAHAWPDPQRRRWFVLGVSGPFVAVWLVGSVAGVIAGPVIPSSWQIGFIVPLMFISVLVPSLMTWPALTAGTTAVVVTLVAKDLPYGLNVLLGALIGIALGVLVPGDPAPSHELDRDLP